MIYFVDIYGNREWLHLYNDPKLTNGVTPIILHFNNGIYISDIGYSYQQDNRISYGTPLHYTLTGKEGWSSNSTFCIHSNGISGAESLIYNNGGVTPPSRNYSEVELRYSAISNSGSSGEFSYAIFEYGDSDYIHRRISW